MESDSFIRDDIIEGYLERNDLRADPYPFFRELRSRRPIISLAPVGSSRATPM